jgi:4-amino-4-deoxy-L-arabinose transferase-like glycosyltransferase
MAGHRWALVLLLGLALAQRLWNAWGVPPLTGYDAPGHAGYMLTILAEARLPHPYQGWSTFHPPLYYLLGSAVWGLLEPLGPRAVVAGIRMIGALAGLFAGFVAFRILIGLGIAPAVALVSTALLLFVPVSQLSAAMIGNEAFAAGMVALALLPLMRLQRDPGDLRTAALAGLACGAALWVKYTAVLLAGAAAAVFAPSERRCVPDRRQLAAAAMCLAVTAAVAAPVYVRNWIVADTPIPLTRNREPMKSAEQAMTIRERRLSDFVWVGPGALRRPSLYHEPGKLGSYFNRNEAMTSVWGMTYASLWFDPFGHRTRVRDHRDEVWHGPVLALLGLAPTLAMLAGFALCWIDLVRRRGRTPEAPLVGLATLGLVVFTGIAASAPSPAALKGSYLLGLGVPAAVFFARAAEALPRPARHALLGVSCAAVAASALVFTTGVLYPAQAMGVRFWARIAQVLPESYIGEAMERMLTGWM